MFNPILRNEQVILQCVPQKKSFSVLLVFTYVFWGFSWQLDKLWILRGSSEHNFCSKTPWTFYRYEAFIVLLCPFQQIHQLKQEKSFFLQYILLFPIFWSYYRNMCYQKNMISSVLIGGFVGMDRASLCMPRIDEKVKDWF